MTPERDPQTILRNLSPEVPVELDLLVSDTPVGVSHRDPDRSRFPPSEVLWEAADNAPSFIGIRIRSSIAQAEQLAARLAAIALERQIEPVFLSYVPHCDMQRFGFRVEQLSGLPADIQADFETQLSRLWKFAIVIDADEITMLG
jgi:hypothetical protein